MNFYTQQHKQYCGVDLPAAAMSVCILDHTGVKLLHKNLPTTPGAAKPRTISLTYTRSPCCCTQGLEVDTAS
jgi:hypothetical protein